jgi:hypothetical protein
MTTSSAYLRPGIAARSFLLACCLAVSGVAGSCSSAPQKSPKNPTSDPGLAQCMKTKVNKACTAISYQLFHNRQAPDAERFASLIKSATALEASAEDILQFKPPYYADLLQDYEECAITLRHYACGLKESAAEKNMNQAVMWFWHVKNVCATCHQVYRFGEETPLRRSPR